MSDAWNSIKIRDFEQVAAAPSLALLRVIGKAPRHHSGVGPRPVLLADDGRSVKRFAALPSPMDDDDLLRAAYSVTDDLLAPGTKFSLQLEDGTVYELPEPRPGTARADSLDGTRAEKDGTVSGWHNGGDRRSDLASKLTELSANLAESERSRGTLEAAALDAWTESKEATDELRTLRERVPQLEGRLAEADQRAIDNALELAAAQDRAEDFEHAHEALEQSIEEQREQIARLEQDVAEAVEARQLMEQSVAPLQVAHERVERELAEAREAIRTMSGDPDAIREARDRATEAEARAEKVGSALADLEIWRGELERRLTEGTDALSAATTAREQGEAEIARLAGELTDERAKVELLRAELEALSEQLEQAGAQTPGPEPGAIDGATLDGAEGLGSGAQRRLLATHAGQLSALLSNVDLLAEIASEILKARDQAENLRAALDAEPSDAPVGEPGVNEPAVNGASPDAQSELAELREELARVREDGRRARTEAIRYAAEAEARELAERELADAEASDF